MGKLCEQPCVCLLPVRPSIGLQLGLDVGPNLVHVQVLYQGCPRQHLSEALPVQRGSLLLLGIAGQALVQPLYQLFSLGLQIQRSLAGMDRGSELCKIGVKGPVG